MPLFKSLIAIVALITSAIAAAGQVYSIQGWIRTEDASGRQIDLPEEVRVYLNVDRISLDRKTREGFFHFQVAEEGRAEVTIWIDHKPAKFEFEARRPLQHNGYVDLHKLVLKQRKHAQPGESLYYFVQDRD